MQENKALTDPLDLLKKEQDMDYKMPFISTGLKALDDMCGGGIGHGLYVFAGPSGVGKTSLMVDIMRSMAKQGKQVLFISQEMSGGAIAKMLFSCCGGKKDSEAATAELESSRGNIAIFDKEASGGRLNAKGCTDIIDKWMLGHPGIVPVVIIDHIQRISSGDDMRSGIIDAVQCLSDYCQKKHLGIMLISQVSGAYRLRSAARMEAKESVDIAYEAHVAINMQMKAVNDNDDDKWGCPANYYDQALRQTDREIILFAYKKRCEGPASIILNFDSINCKFSDVKSEEKKRSKEQQLKKKNPLQEYNARKVIGH